jgi:hypothetical protein
MTFTLIILPRAQQIQTALWWSLWWHQLRLHPRQGPPLNLGAQSHIKVSFGILGYTADVNGISTLCLIEAICTVGLEMHTQFYQASTLELLEKSWRPQRTRPCHSTLIAHMVLSSCMHTGSRWSSARRMGCMCTTAFFSITRAQGEGRHSSWGRSPGQLQILLLVLASSIACTSVISMRRWIMFLIARDYVEGMWCMPQQPIPDDFVLDTGETSCVRVCWESLCGCGGCNSVHIPSWRTLHLTCPWFVDGSILVCKKRAITREKQFFCKCLCEEVYSDGCAC